MTESRTIVSTVLNADIVVIGAGFAGVATAYHLARHPARKRVLLIEKELPIRPQLIGNPPAGFVVGEVQVRPVSLRVLLPQGRTDVPEEILTAPIHMTGVQGTTRVLSTVMVPSGIRPAGERWPDVVVSVTVEPAESE